MAGIFKYMAGVSSKLQNLLLDFIPRDSDMDLELEATQGTRLGNALQINIVVHLSSSERAGHPKTLTPTRNRARGKTQRNALAIDFWRAGVVPALRKKCDLHGRKQTLAMCIMDST